MVSHQCLIGSVAQWLNGIMAQWLNGSAAQWLNGSRASLYTRYPRLFRSSVTRFGFQLRVQILYLYFQMTDGYYWRVRNTFVEVLPAHDLTPSINSPELRRSSSAPPHEARALDLGVMVFNGSSSNPDHLPDSSAPGAVSYIDNARALSEASDPTTSPA